MNVVIVGGGKVGSYLASLLLGEGHNVAVVEARQEHYTALQHDLPAGCLVYGSGTNLTVLDAANIRRANVVAAVTGADETNLVVANLARFAFDVPRVIARVNNPKNAWMFTPEMGVDVALNQADLMGRLIAEEMSLGDMMTLLKLRRGQYSLVEERIQHESPVIGLAVSQLHLPQDCVLVAVMRDRQLIVPRGGTVLAEGDEVLAIVHATQVSQLSLIFGNGTVVAR
ncbi:MAG: TrkA family potassium uptake protein [Anaerolineae bacterium]